MGGYEKLLEMDLPLENLLQAWFITIAIPVSEYSHFDLPHSQDAPLHHVQKYSVGKSSDVVVSERPII